MTPAGRPGDLYVVVHVRETTSSFSGRATTCTAPYPWAIPTLVLGGTVSVPTLAGSETVTGAQGHPDRRPGCACASKGLPRVSGRGRGDLYVTVRVEVPTSLTGEQKALIEELDKTMPRAEADPIRPGAADEDDRPFFDRVKDIFG